MKTFLTGLQKVLFAISALTAFSLIIASLAIYISPSKFWLLYFFGLAWLPLFCFNLFFIAICIIVKLRHAALPVLAFIISFTDVTSFFAFHFSGSNFLPGKNTVRIMSYNVHNFDLYNYNNGNEVRQQMFDLIKSGKPGIVCFQEYFSKDTGYYHSTQTMQQLGYKYFHFEITTTAYTPDNHWGMATFSKYPIINTGRVTFKNETKNSCIYNDIQIGDSIVRVYNVHLQSVFFKQRNYKQLDSVNWDKDGSFLKGEKALTNMKLASQERAQQAELVAASIATSPYPVIVCGDFNDTPSSYAYHTIHGKLQDAFTETGWGIGHSYDEILPIFRIDYILHDIHFKVINYTTIQKKYSDHYLVIADLVRK